MVLVMITAEKISCYYALIAIHKLKLIEVEIVGEKMTDFFTADWHMFHEAILGYSRRPFKNEQEMRKEIIRRHNEVVTPEDTTYVLGDVAMIGRHGLSKLGPILSKMNGTKHLILGNHDEGRPFSYELYGFQTVSTALQYDANTILRHDPASAVVMPDKLWLVGHIHNLFKVSLDHTVCYNVGVDVNDFYPVTLEHIHKEVAKAKEAKKLYDKFVAEEIDGSEHNILL